jgi:uncharacterized protein (DUF885 family)
LARAGDELHGRPAEIAELRARAERELGAGFDVRDFYEAVLSQGALPLDVLEEQVAQFIAARRK